GCRVDGSDRDLSDAGRGRIGETAVRLTATLERRSSIEAIDKSKDRAGMDDEASHRAPRTIDRVRSQVSRSYRDGRVTLHRPGASDRAEPLLRDEALGPPPGASSCF